MMLIAEQFVLLALDPDGTVARGSANQAAAAVGVTGALVTELIQRGDVELTDGRIHVLGSEPPHPLLVQARDGLRAIEGKKLKSRLSSVKHAGWSQVVDTMVDDGTLGRVKDALRPTRHPVANPAAHAALLADVRAAAQGDDPLDDRMAALLALAGPCQMLEVVAPERTARPKARRRIAEAAEQVPAAAAVSFVVVAMQAGSG